MGTTSGDAFRRLGGYVVWLCILALAVFAYLQRRQLEALEAKVRDLTARLAEKPVTMPEAKSLPPPLQAEGEPAKPVGVAPPKGVEPARPIPEPIALRQASRPVMETDAPPAPKPSRSAPPPAPGFAWGQASTWLAENGLAWLGGGGLALGGLLLVVYAAQRGVFTPPFRVAAAAILGLLMVGASEWIRRQTQAPGGRHALAAATAAGAGAVTLYGAVWAAHILYGLIPLPLAAVLAVAVSGGLLTLALLHGEALALLALLGAFLAPAIARHGHWPALTLDAYLILLAVTGAAVTGLRRWGGAGIASLVGLTFWSLASLFEHRPADAAVLLALAFAAPLAGILWRTAHASDETGKTDLFARLPLIGLIVVSVASLFLWSGDLDASNHWVAPILLGAGLVLAGAALARQRLVPPQVFAAPVAVTAAGLLLDLILRRLSGGHAGAQPLPGLVQTLGLAALIAGAGLAAGLRLPLTPRTPLLAIGAVGAAVLANLAWPLLDPPSHATVDALGGAAAGLTALLLASGTVLIARRVEEPRRDPGLGLWVAAAAELAFLAIHALVPEHLEPAALALAALALAACANRLAWRGLAATAVAGGIVTLAALLRPAFVQDATGGALALPLLALVVAVATAALAAAARIVGATRRDHRTEAQALSTAALLTLLGGLFLILHVVLAGAAPPEATPLLEASLRTALALGAGLLLATRGRPDDGPIARWRLIAVVSLGAAHGLVTSGLWLNPWWGAGRLAGGLPLLNDLLLALLAPALLLAATARARPDPAGRWTRGWIAAAAVFALLWAVTAVRHAFHGAAMDAAPVGPAEACAYATLALLTARAFRIERLKTSRAAWLHAAAPIVGWTALVAALLVFWLASPWWGLSDAPMRSAGHVVLLLALYAAGAGAALSLRRGRTAFDRAALCLSVGVLFALITLALRFAFHGVDMRQGLDRGGLETWAFSAVWTVFGLAVLFRASARKDVALRWLGLIVLLATAGKVLLFDMATLDGVVRAASFLAVGALFIAGALVARRLNAGHKSGTDESTDRSPAHEPDLADHP